MLTIFSNKFSLIFWGIDNFFEVIINCFYFWCNSIIKFIFFFWFSIFCISWRLIIYNFKENRKKIKLLYDMRISCEVIILPWSYSIFFLLLRCASSKAFLSLSLVSFSCFSVSFNPCFIISHYFDSFIDWFNQNVSLNLKSLTPPGFNNQD